MKPRARWKQFIDHNLWSIVCFSNATVTGVSAVFGQSEMMFAAGLWLGSGIVSTRKFKQACKRIFLKELYYLDAMREIQKPAK